MKYYSEHWDSSPIILSSHRKISGRFETKQKNMGYHQSVYPMVGQNGRVTSSLVWLDLWLLMWRLRLQHHPTKDRFTPAQKLPVPGCPCTVGVFCRSSRSTKTVMGISRVVDWCEVVLRRCGYIHSYVCIYEMLTSSTLLVTCPGSLDTIMVR